MRVPVRLVLGTLAALLALSCGGGGEPAKTPARTETDDPEANGSASREKEQARAPAPSRPACDDDSCFPCGAGFCPTGFYCDDSAPGGAACAWIPECERTSCDCVTHALGAVRCETQGGGPHVSGK